MLRICDSINKKELESLRDSFNFETIKNWANKVLSWLWIDLWTSKFPNSKLIKLKLTWKYWAWRILYLLVIEDKNNKTIYPIILRHKNDKEIWNNMSFKNKKFCNVLNRNLDLIFKDLKNWDFEDYKI